MKEGRGARHGWMIHVLAGMVDNYNKGIMQLKEEDWWRVLKHAEDSYNLQ